MPSPDAKLRQMVVELAALHPGDAKAVLSALDPAQREKVEAMLRAFSPFHETPPAADAPAIDGTRVARWLAKRFESHPKITMTDPARAALRACAMRLYPAPVRPSARRTKRRERVA